MADNLIFPIGFDLERGVKDAQAQMDSALRRLQKTVDGKPLTIPMSLDSSKFTTFESALRGSIQHITDDAKNLKAALDGSLQTDNSANINRITEAMRSLEAAWKALPNNQKFDINDRLTPKAQKMVQQFNELATASSTYGQTLSQIAGKIKRAADEEARANQKRNDGYAKLRKTLGAQENSIANLSAKIKAYQQILNSKEIGSKSFERVADKIRKLTEQLDRAKVKVAELTGQTQSGAARQSAAVKQVSQEFKNQETYVTRLIKRMAVYASFSYVGNFLTNVREVTAQFELQRVSLGAIIQDQNRANQLFSEIKSFALKSPVSILDLTKYTKQLAAYKVGWDGVKTDTKELFDWTKKLTDVSVGLGVSMDRVVLAFGQVRATGYLRASEVRQFTEMGVPIVEELAAKLSKLNGEAVTAAEVMDMISKRGISFEMVKDVFDDMTSAGGMFYNMQEKQGNTLYGMWAKLGDAASVMYDEIGNTGWVNQAMKGLIQGLTDVMKHWGSWAKLIGIVGTAYLANAGALKLLSLVSLRYTAAGAKLVGISRAKALAAVAEAKATRNAGFMAQWGARRDLALALAKYKAATATNVLSASLHRLWAAFLANPLGWIITIVGAAIAIFGDFDNTLDNLQGKLSEINEKYTLKNLNDVDNFKRLADGALKAAAGSKEQRDKLAELDRTYGEILGSENLQIDKLRAMNGEYGSLIETIKEYNTQMKYSEREGAIKEYYGGKKKDAFGEFEDELSTIGFGSDELGHEAGASIAINIQDALLEELEKNGKATVDNANRLLKKQLTNVFVARGKSQEDAAQWASIIIERLSSETEAYVEALNSERNALDANSDAAEKASGKLGVLRKEIEAAKRKLDKKGYVHADKSVVDYDSFLYQQMVANATMKKAADLIRNSQEMKDALGDKAKELEPEWLHLVDTINTNDLANITTVNFDALLSIIGDKYPDLKRRIKLIQEEWGNVAPTDAIVLQIRNKLMAITNSFGLSMDKMKIYLWDGSEGVDAYLKRLKEQQDELKKRLKEKEQTLLHWSMLDRLRNGETKEQIQAEVDGIKKEIAALDQQVAFTTEYTISDNKNNNRGGGTKSDPRPQILNEMVQLAEKLNKEYSDWEKKVGSTKALEKVNDTYAETVKYAEKVAKDAGITLPHLKTPTNAKELNEYLEAVRKVMESAKGLKGGKKAAIELAVKMSNNVSAEDQKAIEEKIKALADRISRTKTAKEFYEKILSQTGDVELAANLSLSIYGENGEDLDKAIRDNIQATLGKNKQGIDLDFSAAIRADGSVDYNALTKIAKGYLDMGEISEETYNKILKMRDEDRKDLAKTVEGWLKATEKAKTYSDKLLDLRRKTQTEIDSINEKERRGDITPEFAESQRTGFLRKEAEEVAKLQYEAFKDSPMYVQMFDDLDNASTTMLRNMKQRIEELKTSWKDLTPTQLKEMQSRLNEIDAQLAKRNPFKGLIDGIKEYRNLRKGGDTLGNKSEGAAEKALDAAAKARLEAEKEYLEILNKEGATQEEIADAKKRFDKAAADEDAAAKALENWKKVKDTIGLSANELFQMLNWAGDIARGIADISEAMGADEEDVQYWNDVADALSDISGGIQDIVSAAMSGNVTGIISSTLTAIPKMFVGFTNLFSAGKIKRANKEIKRQQQLLDQLEYTYGRLEKAADKLFGRDYVNNYNQQLKNLQAQQQAYLKQAQAERSKGKKEDKEKTKQFEEQARETADKIKELQDDLVAHFTGSSRTDVARQMAKSWIDARASMSDTFAAIKGNYQDMIKNMIVEGAAARVIENALTPVWDSMDKMLEKNDVQGAIDSLIGGMDAALTQANNGMEVLWKALEARGYDMKKLISDTDASGSEYSGIAKSVAGATSEEINNVAAIGNTLMYYASPIPRIDENLARVVAIMEGKTAALPTASGGTTGAIDYTDMFATANQHLSSLPRMEQHLSEIHTILGRIITTKGGRFGVKIYM